jgi:hypothetical protein
MHRMHVHAVSLTPQAKYDTACTIDERFERPWQPVKGVFAIEIRSYLGEFEAELKKDLACESGAQGILFDRKKRRSKISWHCPFNAFRSSHLMAWIYTD